MRIQRAQLRKYFIMGSQDCTRSPEEILLEAAKAGITAFQFREKGPGSLSGSAKLELGKKLRKICSEYGILFIINNDVELIEPLQADGIHVGQQDERTDTIRARFPDTIIGLSVTNIEEASRPSMAYADYVGAGPVYRTATKIDAKEPVGTAWIRELRALLPEMPMVAIGGITPDNARFSLEAGADGVAVVSAITKSGNIRETVALL